MSNAPVSLRRTMNVLCAHSQIVAEVFTCQEFELSILDMEVWPVDWRTQQGLKVGERDRKDRL